MSQTYKAIDNDVYYIGYGADVASTGRLGVGLTIHISQPLLYVNENLIEFMQYIDDQSINGVRELPDVGELIRIGFYILDGKIRYCLDSHIRSVLTYQTTEERVLIPPDEE